MTRAKHQDAILGAVLLCSSFALYWSTLAPTATLVDSGELTFAASTLDIAHPPGTPFYVLLGFLFSKLPLGSAAVRMNIMSAVFASASVLLLYWACSALLHLLTSEDKQLPRKRQTRTLGKTAFAWELTDGGIRLAAFLASATLATSATLWSYATVAEVYTLNTALLAAALGATFSALHQRRAFLLDIAGLFFGCALAVHHVSALFLVPALAYLLFRFRDRLPAPHRLFRSALFLGPGLLSYLYLPIRSASHPYLNWGNPSTLERLLWHVSGKQYQSNLSGDAGTVARRMTFFADLWATEFSVLGILFGLVGLVLLWKYGRRLFWFATTAIAANMGYAVVYDIAEDNEAYSLPSFLVLALCLAVASAFIIARWPSINRRLGIALLILLSLVPILSGFTHYKENDHRGYTLARDYVASTFDGVEQDGLLLTMDWQLFSPMLYFQRVEGWRPDIKGIDVNLMRRSWYLEHLHRNFPRLLAPVSEEFDFFSRQLELFEHGKSYDPAIIQRAFENLVNGLIRIQMEGGRPVYVTLDLEAEPGIGRDYFRVPRGTVFQLVRSRPEKPLPAPAPAAAFARTDVSFDPVMQRVRRNYAVMLVNRGIYLSLYGLHGESLGWYENALRLAPELPVAHTMMSRSYQALGRTAEAEKAYSRAAELEAAGQQF